MSNQTYAWKRFWIPREGSFRPDGGYLLDPDAEWGVHLNPDVVSFEGISNLKCLILLGEPGIGKTQEISDQWRLIEKEANEIGDVALRFDLRDYQTDTRLHQDIIENPIFSSWLKGTHRLYLFLDSLDEGLLAINPLATILLKELKECPNDRMFLRIACRTAEWPSILEDGLSDLWGKDDVKIYELLPLRRIDVTMAAEANGLYGKIFLDEVARKEAGPLASKPVTLKLLLKTYIKYNQFPHTRTKLYSEGCRLLCDEVNDSRIASRRTGLLTADQRLIIAARIAAITIFANRSAIWVGKAQEDITDGDMALQDIYGESETVAGERLPVNEAAVREVLGTGLFSFRGPHRLGWAHQTYAEFLAAWYLEQRGMQLKQRFDLIFHHGGLGRKLAPQLHETAAWLAGMDKDVFQEVMKTDPEVLLRSDVANKEDKDREQLVETLLRLINDEMLLGDRFSFSFNDYRKLYHPKLIEQLRSYIIDNNKGLYARRIAIDIAQACQLKELQNELVDIALDSSNPIELRKDAVQALGILGDDKAKERLKPLVKDSPDDPDEDLKGWALRAVWPNSLTAEELFAVLTSPRMGYYGSYEMFISDHLAQCLLPSDLPTALGWIEEQPSKNSLAGGLSGLIDKIMLKAWENLDEPNVLEPFTKAALSRLMLYDSIVEETRSPFDSLKRKPASPRFSSLVEKDDTKRHLVLLKMAEQMTQPEKLWLFSWRNPFLIEKDLSWMINQFELTALEESRLVWIQLIRDVFNWENPDLVDVLYQAIERNNSLANVFLFFGRSVDLDSVEAQEMREQYLERQRREKQERPSIKPSPAERVIELLNELEAGDYSAWWHLNYVMIFETDGSASASERQPDLRALPGWETANEETKARIINGAKEYVLNGNPGSYEWLKEKDYIDRPAFAGYRALHLLFSESMDFIPAVSPMAWKNWAPIILAFPSTGNSTNNEIQSRLMELAYPHAYDEVLDILKMTIDREGNEFDQLHMIDMIDSCWDERISKVFLDKLKSENIVLGTMKCLLSKLLAHNVRDAEDFAKALVSLQPPIAESQLPKAVEAARQMILHTEDLGWSIIWPVIQSDNNFGRKLAEKISYYERRTEKIANTLSEKELADLYIWLVQNYAYEDDPKYPKGYSFDVDDYVVTPRKSVSSWRDSVLSHLQKRGTIKACDEIRRISRKFPELDWLKRTLMTAQKTALLKTWEPPEPRAILELARTPQSGLVQSGDQLLDMVIESLKRLERVLQDNTTAAIFLWNEIDKGVYKPKDENLLSDYIKIHLIKDLEPRGIIINREVEIRRGERTDIHVDAIRKQPNGEIYDKISIIIEVKGCWNKDLKRSMETQLVNRYLRNNHCNHGLYLVGWFNCKLWDPKDYRRRQCPKYPSQKAQDQFDAQAAKLSNVGKVIKAFVINASLRDEEKAGAD